MFRKMTDTERDVARRIGLFYFEKERDLDKDADTIILANKANEILRKLGITGIEVEGNIIHIKLNKPGLLIGSKGKTLSELEEYLFKTNLVIKWKIEIHEDDLLDSLYVYFPMYEAEGDYDFDDIVDDAIESDEL